MSGIQEIMETGHNGRALHRAEAQDIIERRRLPGLPAEVENWSCRVCGGRTVPILGTTSVQMCPNPRCADSLLDARSM